MSQSLRRWLPLSGLAVVLVATLAVGAMGRGDHQTITDRVHHITAQLRCPVCSGETVADSNALISQDIRAEVQKRIEGGQSNARIAAFVIQQYPGTRLVPPARGVGLLVWLLPVIGFAVAATGLIVSFSRRHSRSVLSVSDDDRALVEQALVDQAARQARAP